VQPQQKTRIAGGPPALLKSRAHSVRPLSTVPCCRRFARGYCVVVSNGTTITAKGMEGSGCGLFRIAFRHLPVRTEESHVRLESSCILLISRTQARLTEAAHFCETNEGGTTVHKDCQGGRRRQRDS
jgi:hypothetical protein